MKGRISLVLVAACGLPLFGCATTPGQCDPREVDFFKNTGCLASGAYGERQRAMQATLGEEQRRNAAFRAVLTELKAEQTKISRQLGARQAEYTRLDAAWRRLKQSLASDMKASPALADRVQRIDREVAARKAEDGAADVAKRRATRDDLQRQVTLLEKELDVGVY